jgi:hypothetical protein
MEEITCGGALKSVLFDILECLIQERLAGDMLERKKKKYVGLATFCFESPQHNFV